MKSVKCFQSANSYHIDIEWKKNLVANLGLGWGSFNLLTQVYQREMLLFLLHFITFIGHECETLLSIKKKK